MSSVNLNRVRQDAMNVNIVQYLKHFPEGARHIVAAQMLNHDIFNWKCYFDWKHQTVDRLWMKAGCVNQGMDVSIIERIVKEYDTETAIRAWRYGAPVYHLVPGSPYEAEYHQGNYYTDMYAFCKTKYDQFGANWLPEMASLNIAGHVIAKRMEVRAKLRADEADKFPEAKITRDWIAAALYRTSKYGIHYRVEAFERVQSQHATRAAARIRAARTSKSEKQMKGEVEIVRRLTTTRIVRSHEWGKLSLWHQSMITNEPKKKTRIQKQREQHEKRKKMLVRTPEANAEILAKRNRTLLQKKLFKEFMDTPRNTLHKDANMHDGINQVMSLNWLDYVHQNPFYRNHCERFSEVMQDIADHRLCHLRVREKFIRTEYRSIFQKNWNVPSNVVDGIDRMQNIDGVVDFPTLWDPTHKISSVDKVYEGLMHDAFVYRVKETELAGQSYFAAVFAMLLKRNRKLNPRRVRYNRLIAPSLEECKDAMEKKVTRMEDLGYKISRTEWVVRTEDYLATRPRRYGVWDRREDLG